MATVERCIGRSYGAITTWSASRRPSTPVCRPPNGHYRGNPAPARLARPCPNAGQTGRRTQPHALSGREWPTGRNLTMARPPRRDRRRWPLRSVPARRPAASVLRPFHAIPPQASGSARPLLIDRPYRVSSLAWITNNTSRGTLDYSIERFLIDRLPVDQETLDDGTPGSRHRRNHRHLALIAGIFNLAPLPLRDEIALDAEPQSKVLAKTHIVRTTGRAPRGAATD